MSPSPSLDPTGYERLEALRVHLGRAQAVGDALLLRERVARLLLALLLAVVPDRHAPDVVLRRPLVLDDPHAAIDADELVALPDDERRALIVRQVAILEATARRVE